MDRAALPDLERVRELLARGNGELAAFLRNLHPVDLAELVTRLPDPVRLHVFRLLDDERAALVLEQLDVEVQAEVLRLLDRQRAGGILEEMSADDLADLLGALPPDAVEPLLRAMAAREAADVAELLTYPPDTAGGIMTTDFVAVRPGMTAQEVIDYLRSVGPDAETIYYVYVVDDHGHLAGVLSLRELIVAPPGRRVSEIMQRNVVAVRVEDDEEEVARQVARYDLLAVPVVDAERRLRGVVTVDDVLDVVEKIRAEELLRIVGSDAVELERKRPVQIARARLPWLAGTLAIELLAGLVIHRRFDETIARFALLASFMPIISAISGNVGLQAATVVVRGLATGLYSPRAWLRPVSRELGVDLILGLVLGVALAGVGFAWSGSGVFALAVGLALPTAMLTAGLMGSLIPMVTKRLGYDPALTAGPFETAFQDVVGFAVFLTLAAHLFARLGG